MLMKLFNKQSLLQNKLTFYPLFWFTVGLLVTFIVTVALIKIYLDRYLMTQIVAYSQQTAKDITNIIDRDKETISAFLLSDTMRDLKNETRLVVALERLLSQNKNFLEGFVIDLEGNTLVSVSLLEVFTNNKPDFRTQTIYLEAKTGKISISGWENFTEKSLPYWNMAIPIEKYPGKVIGVLIVTIDLRRIEDIILTSQGAKYGNPVLLDHNGKVLVHLDRSKLGNNWSNLDITRKVIRGDIGTTNYYDENGQYVLAAYQPLNPYKWGLIVQVPPGQTVYVIRDKVILLFSLMMIIIFIVTGLFTYIAAGKVVAPIKELTSASQKFGKGEKIEYIPVDGNDEIAQLSTAFYEMAASLQDQEKQRAQYISMIAHDLRNPLTSIKEIFKMLQIEGIAETEKIDNLSSINTRLEQVNRMVGDLLEFSRLDLGQIDYSPETISIKYLCQNILSGYHNKSHKIIIKSFSDEICAWADPIRLEQIIQNIMDNCFKHTPAGTIVTIDCFENEATVRIEIDDNGPGIAPEILKNMFEPFQTGGQKKGSYGLGMAIAKKLAVGMHGDLKVSSEEKVGTKLTVTLPKAKTI